MDSLDKPLISERVMVKLLQIHKTQNEPLDIAVTGTSMEPVLYEGDIIRLQPQEDYQAGDILVFNYNDNELLTHRLLLKKGGRFFCKGDNCYRLENVSPAQIIGKVTHINGNEAASCSQKLIALSYAVGQRYDELNYDYILIQQTDIYKLYAKIFIREESNPMVYQKNSEMEYIPADDTSLLVFDPDSGDTHLFDEKGIDILSILEEPVDLETMLAKLCEIYEAEPDTIQAGVEKLIKQAVESRVIIVL